jgi:c-di-GMP-binding flagellar brake protein YcgR
MRAMYVSPAFALPVFQERGDRRKRQRFAYPATVQINGRPSPARDISPKGLSVLVAPPAVGDVVRVTLAAASGDAEEISSPARVVRVDREKEGYVVGLEFIE